MSAPKAFRCVVMGSESLLVSCSEILLAEGHTIVAVITDDEDIARFAEERRIPVVTPGPDLAARLGQEPLGQEPFEWLFSIANLSIIPGDVLALPSRGAINFHDGPLPRYAGLNATSWAILHGERTHGVSWHRVEGGVDEGDLLEQRIFELAERETALTLNTRCYELGIETFARLVEAIGRGEEKPRPQDLSQRTYFGRYDRPPAACAIDFAEPAHRVDALVRALDFGRYPNPLGVPKILVGGGVVLLPDVEPARDSVSVPPGTIIASDDAGLEVATATGSLLFPRVLDEAGAPLTAEDAARRGLAPGVSLAMSRETRDRLSAIDADLARHEPFWVRRLTSLEPAQLPAPGEGRRADANLVAPSGAGAGAGQQTERRMIEASADPARLVAVLTAWISRVSGKARLDLAFRHPGIAERVRGAEALYARFVPLRVEVDREKPLAALEQAAKTELARAIEHGTYPGDLVHRYPRVQRPEWGVAFEQVESIDACACEAAPLTIATDGERAALCFDPARVATKDAEALRQKLELFLTADALATPVGLLPLLSAEERRRVLVEWNATAADVPRDRAVHQLFEAQVDRTPDACALVFEGEELTYRELDRRANQLAHHLVALGVLPDTPVGLSTERSLELVIGALGILKAGGAYVPLDPSYPADRVAFMLEDCRASVVVTHGAARLPAGERTVVLLDEHAGAIATRPTERPTVDVRGSSLAYLIYTSGSTGTPKGVMIEHRNVANFFAGMDRVIRPDEHERRVPTAQADQHAASQAALSGSAPASECRGAYSTYVTTPSADVSPDQRRLGSRASRAPEPRQRVWLAVTSLSFDISVLELFYTLARGFTVVVAREADRAHAQARERQRTMDLSLFYFASDEGEKAADKYRLLLDGARFADAHGFSAVWTPERHFHAFGGLYPNPSVASAALAVITERVKLRAGSCVSPLHHPIRIAEEWALVDNLSNGRVGISFAAGWQPNDFALRPEAFAGNKQRMVDEIEVVRRLWRGEAIEFPGPKGPVSVRTLPRPVQRELPFWITAAGNPETFQLAGRLGGGILTHLLGQSLEDVRQKVEVYRAAWREAGHPGEGHVALMLHTFVGEDDAIVKETVREPMKGYLRSAMQLIQQHAWSFPAFKRLAREERSFEDNFLSLSKEDTEALLDHSFERYYESSGLFGNVERCVEIVEKCRAIGVDEVACLIDYGIDSDTVMAHLPQLAAVREAVSGGAASRHRAAAPGKNAGAELPARSGADGIAAQLVRHRVTHMQCTPSMARMILGDDEARAALRGLSHLMIGGEAFPGALARELSAATGARITNMYGPTETTVWSSTHDVEQVEDGTVPIGRPIANTSLYVLDEGREPLPPGVAGELYIGGDGVARGYWARTELSAERFVPDPFAGKDGARMYRTGDAARRAEDGRVEFLGRIDQQVKIRGYRIELGEIEARLAAHPSVREAVVIAREDVPGDARIAAYVRAAAPIDVAALKAHLAETLPEFMVPPYIVELERFPLTPNKKIDRRALPRPEVDRARPEAAPQGGIEETIGAIWRRILGLSEVSRRDNFFELGGHSLLAVQAHREIKEALSGKPITVTDIFRFPTIAALAAHLEGGDGAQRALEESRGRAVARKRAATAGSRRVLRRR